MGFTSMNAQGAGVGMQTVGAYYTAVGQKTSLKAQAYLDENNAKLAEASAQSALLQGQRGEQAVRLKGAQVKSAQRTAFAANGIDLASTTPVSVLTSTDAITEIDAVTVAANAMRTAFGYQSQALNFRNRASGARATADGINPLMNAGSTLLSGATSVADSWYKLDKAGAFDSKDPAKNDPNDGYFARMMKSSLVSDALY